MWLVDIPEEPDGLPRNIDGAPEIHVEHLPRLFLRGGLEFAHQGGPSIVINDVDATESNFRSPESVFDIVGVGYIDLEDQELALCPHLEQVLERFRLPHSGDDDITLCQRIRGEGQAEAGGCAGYCVQRWDEETVTRRKVAEDILNQTR